MILNLFIPISLTVISLILLLLSFRLANKSLVILAFWLSLAGIIIHYNYAGNHILGTYFNYSTSFIYSINLLVLLASLLYLILASVSRVSLTNSKIIALIISGLISLSVMLILANLWINAYFVENKAINSKIIQVSNDRNNPICHHHYIFYKIATDNQVQYLCPNAYGLLPSIGKANPSEILKRHLLPENLNKS